MGEAATTTEASLTELQASLDLLHGRVACMDTTQHQLVAQLGLIATAVQDSARMHDDAARQFAVLEQRLDASTQAMADLRVRAPYPEEDEADPADCVVIGKGTLRTAHVTWAGNTEGASSATHAGDSPCGGSDGLSALGGGGILGGVGSGGTGGAGGGRPSSGGEQHSKHQLKMSFPRFDGDQPRIWKDKCLDYFRLFNVHPSLWLVSCTLHMDGNAALWLKAYRRRHEVNSWTALMTAVEEKFGADDHRNFMKQLLSLIQRGTILEYQAQFEELLYQVSMHNPNYDEQFFVSQFIRGLKPELRGAVEAHVPETVERAILLALV